MLRLMMLRATNQFRNFLFIDQQSTHMKIFNDETFELKL